MQPKSNITFKLASINVLKLLVDGIGFKYSHYSGHYAHRVENLCKSAANTDFRGVGGHLGCYPKVM